MLCEISENRSCCGWRRSVTLLSGSTSAVTSSIAAEYARIWSALRSVAQRRRVRPNVVLLTLAIAEGAQDSSDLENVMLVHDSVVRRGLADAYAAGLVEGEASDGGRRRHGVRTAVRLTADGASVAEDVAATIAELAESAD